MIERRMPQWVDDISFSYNNYVNGDNGRRDILINKVARLCPYYSTKYIQDLVYSIPLYLDAEFVVHKALLDESKCFKCPSYTFGPLPPVNGFMQHNNYHQEKHKSNTQMLKQQPVTNSLNWEAPLGPTALQTDVSLAEIFDRLDPPFMFDCEPQNTYIPPNPDDVSEWDINIELFDPQPSTSKRGTESAQNGSINPPVLTVFDDMVNDKSKGDTAANTRIPKAKNLNLVKNKRKSKEKTDPAPHEHNMDGGEVMYSGTANIAKKIKVAQPADFDDQPVVVEEGTSTGSNRDLVNHLAEIFPDALMSHLRELCYGQPFTPQAVNVCIDKLLSEEYPKEQDEPIDYDAYLETMRSVLPDADPVYLSTELDKMKSSDDLKEFMSHAVELKNYPKAADAERQRQLNAQVRQYTTDFVAGDFLKIIPDPEKYFNDDKFKTAIITLHSPTYATMIHFLKNHYNRLPVKYINTVLAKSKTFLKAVEMFDGTTAGFMVSRRRFIAYPPCSNIPLLQMLAYVGHKQEILQTKKNLETLAVERKQKAIENKEVKTCSCCYDEEVMPDDAVICPNGCLACKECIGRSVEILFAENKLNFPCVTSCGASFTLDTLQACLTPKLFSKIAQRKQLEEVKSAGIEDLELCPLCCDFAAIPAAENRIFRCYNPECMKETCRACKQPSHVPLSCEEVEQDSDVMQRKYVEDQMTEALLRTCWKCNLKFIKSDGCNKITCECGAMMCYICNVAVKDYNHFNGQGSNFPDRCPLYSNTVLEHELAAIRGGFEAKKELGVTNMKVDPMADANQRLQKAKNAVVAIPQ